MPDPRQQPTVRPWLPAVTEVFFALVVLAATTGIILNDLSAHLAFLGETAVITSSDVESYWTLVVALGTAVAGSLLAAAWRQRTLHRAGWAWGWHLLMALAGTATALVFSVTTVGSVDQPRPDPAPPTPDRRPATAPAATARAGDSPAVSAATPAAVDGVAAAGGAVRCGRSARLAHYRRPAPARVG